MSLNRIKNGKGSETTRKNFDLEFTYESKNIEPRATKNHTPQSRETLTQIKAELAVTNAVSNVKVREPPKTYRHRNTKRKQDPQ